MEAGHPNAQNHWNKMIYDISQKFYFDAAHTLQRQFETESSRRIHGHTYSAEVTISGRVNQSTGMVADLAELRSTIAAIREKLDHHFLDEVEGLGPPTLENLCAFILSLLIQTIPQISSVKVWRESSGDSCLLRAT